MRLITLIVLFFGVGSVHGRLVGSWRLESLRTEAAGKHSEALQENAGRRFLAGHYHIEFAAGGSYRALRGADAAERGTWKREGENLVLQALGDDEKPVGKEQRFRISAENEKGLTLEWVLPARVPGKLLLELVPARYPVEP